MTRKASLAVLVVWYLVLIATLLAQGLSSSDLVLGILYYILVVGGCIVYPIVSLCFNESGENCNTSIAILNNPDANDIDIEDDNTDPIDFTVSIDGASIESNEENPVVIELGCETRNYHRIHFLDNIKTFLTMVVVSHHVGCAFGGAQNDSWFLVIGNYDSLFNRLLGFVLELNQGYFMPLFFFISAYFTPSSYKKKGKWNFHEDKARRLAIPLIGVTLFICPVTFMFAAIITENQIFYFQSVGHAWFILWLILLNVVYSTICEAEDFARRSSNERLSHHLELSDESDEHIQTSLVEQRKMLFPGTCQRLLAGTMICGCLMVAVIILLEAESFMGMPITIGSLICNLLFFYLGTCAKQHGWLEQSLREQLDIPIWLLWLSVVFEAGIMCTFTFVWDNDSPLGGLLYIPTAGLFCLDMSLVVLELFQSYADFSTPTTRYFSEAAYTVYLIHPVVVTGFTAVFLVAYRAWNVESKIEFDGGYFATASSSKFVGPDNGGGTLALGFVIVNILSHLLLWPIAWQLKQLPGLQHIL